MFYRGKRRSPQEILLFTLLGFIIIAGVQRFVIGQIGMGILYLLTGGLCLIGTIVDLVNHRTLALEYNPPATMMYLPVSLFIKNELSIYLILPSSFPSVFGYIPFTILPVSYAAF